MIPDFDKNGNLPYGIHPATWQEVGDRYGWNTHRRNLLMGLYQALRELGVAGCRAAFVNGSFVTVKDDPGDFDG